MSNYIHQLEAKFDTYDYAIGGKLVTGSVTIDDSIIIHGDKMAADEIKQNLIQQMASYMLENKLVEFTHYTDPIQYRKTIRIRAYLAKDSHVNILRVYKKLIES